MNIPKPLIPWESEKRDHPQVIWASKLDNRFLIEVHRVETYAGMLHVFDHEKDDLEVTCFRVTLSYGAIFGPDAMDVRDWQEKVTDFIDNTHNKQ